MTPSDKLRSISGGLKRVQKGPYKVHTVTQYGDRSQQDEIEIWNEDCEILICKEVRRAHTDGGVETMDHFARCDPETIQDINDAYFTMLEALEAAQVMIREALPKFDWGKSFLDANAIQQLNETPIKVDAAIARANGDLKASKPATAA